MTIGVGVDLVEIAALQKSAEQSKRFIPRVFTAGEIEYCETKPLKYQHYAARFAAKEAVMKALGTGWDKGISWKQIEVQGSLGKKPDVVLYKAAKALALELHVKNIHVSLSHSGNYAIAQVILTTE